MQSFPPFYLWHTGLETFGMLGGGGGGGVDTSVSFTEKLIFFKMN